MRILIALAILVTGCKFKPYGCAAMDAHVEEFDCHEVTEMMQTDPTNVLWETSKVCDWRCVK